MNEHQTPPEAVEIGGLSVTHGWASDLRALASRIIEAVIDGESRPQAIAEMIAAHPTAADYHAHCARDYLVKLGEMEKSRDFHRSVAWELTARKDALEKELAALKRAWAATCEDE